MTNPLFNIRSETKNCIYMEPDTRCVPHKKVKEGEKWVKHVYLEFSRFHVLSYYRVYTNSPKEKAFVKCSELDCIVNKNHKPVS